MSEEVEIDVRRTILSTIGLIVDLERRGENADMQIAVLAGLTGVPFADAKASIKRMVNRGENE